MLDDWDEQCPKELYCEYNSDFDHNANDITLFIRCDHAKEMGLVNESSDDEEISRDNEEITNINEEVIEF